MIGLFPLSDSVCKFSRAVLLGGFACVLGLSLLASAPAWAQEDSLAELATNNASRPAANMWTQQSETVEKEALSEKLSKNISVEVEDLVLEEVLRQIAEKGDVELVYGSHSVLSERTLTLRLDDVSVRAALSRAVEGTELKPMLSSSGYIVLIKRSDVTVPQMEQEGGTNFSVDPPNLDRVPVALRSSQPQQGMITGTVTDSVSGEPIPGANVVVAETQRGASTDENGQYTIPSVEAGTYTLQASFIGYGTKTRSDVVVREGETTEVNFQMVETALQLEEVVTIGYGEQERDQVTGSITSVDVEKANRVSSAGFQEALQGRIAGVNINLQDGRPGGQMDVDIRGVSTFGNNNPLYVIDGVPILDERDRGNINPLASLNPNDIESVEVLKDASAAAIYGARAANGVILVTTKGGHDGDPVFRFSTKTGISEIPEYKRIDMMNSEQFIEFTIDAYENSGLPLPPSVQEPNLSENLQRNTDWQEAGFNQAVIQNYNFSVSGGGKTATYSFKGGYLDEQGTLVSTGYKRYTTRMNTDVEVKDWISVGGILDLSRSRWKGLYNPSGDLIQEMLQSAPTMPVRNEDNLGGFAGPRPRYSPVNRANRVGELKLTGQHTTSDRLISNVYTEVSIIDNLNYRIDGSVDIRKREDYQYTPQFVMGNRSQNQADLDEGRSGRNSYTLENTLTYDTVFRDIHDISLLAGFSIQDITSDNVDLSISGFPSKNIRVVDGGTGNFSVGGSETSWSMVSQWGRVTYTLSNKYNLMATIRRDGSSRFGPENRYGVFPSLSGNWNAHREDFVDIDAISSLRLRVSWGRAGSQDIANYAATSGIDPNVNYIIGGNQQVAPAGSFTTMGNANLKWETTTQTNIGIDIALFNGALNITTDYFRKNTDDVLLRVPIATTSGIARDNGPFVNAASMTNEGLELEADYTNNIGNIGYEIAGNISSVRNEITKLGTGGEPIINNVRIGGATAQMTTITRPNEAMSSFYGWIADGTFFDEEDVQNHATQPNAEPGDVKFRDLNNDGVINTDDKTIIGNPFPDFTYGLDVTVDYAGISLGVLLKGEYGHDIYNLSWYDLNTTPQFNNQTTMMVDRWTPDNRDTNVPRAVKNDPNDNNRSSTRFVEDGSYLSIQSLNLAYTLDQELINRIGLSRLSVNFSVRNLYMFTDYRNFDPEVGEIQTGPRSSLSRGVDFGVYPRARNIELGLDLVF